MSDGYTPEPAGLARLFIVEITSAPDALVRVLSVCAARQIALSSVAFEAVRAGGAVRIEAAGLGDHDAQRLAARLQSEPVVVGVTVGWRVQA
jgi:acetolactate synthase regulatory subunit